MDHKEVTEMIKESEDRQQQLMYNSHVAINKTVSGIGYEIKELRDENKCAAIKQQELIDAINNLDEKMELVGKHETRIKNLEGWRSTLIGAWSVVTLVIIPIAMTLILEKV